jgi:hypothetical protein
MNDSLSSTDPSRDELTKAFADWLASPWCAAAFRDWLLSPEQEWRWHAIVARLIDAFAPPLLLLPILEAAVEIDGPLPPAPVPNPVFVKGPVLVMAEMSNTQRKRLHFQVFNRLGGPARFDGAPEWSTDNSDVLRLEPAPNGLSCFVYAVGPITDVPVNVTMQADADLGEGVRPIIGTIAFVITAGEAERIELMDDPAEEQADEPAPTGAGGTAPGDGGGGPAPAPTDAGDTGATGGPAPTAGDTGGTGDTTPPATGDGGAVV